MKILKPSYTILSPELVGSGMLKNIERAGRTCYKSEDKITDDSAAEFVRMIISRGHESVLEHEKVSVLFVCDRGVSHELVRHRIASFSQESTRYCNYTLGKFDGQISVIQPLGLPDEMHRLWYAAMVDAEVSYRMMIEAGVSPQIARSILPNSLKTEIVVTANLREWRTIFKQRTSPAAHPQMRELMCPLLDEMKRLLPVVFDDIAY